MGGEVGKAMRTKCGPRAIISHGLLPSNGGEIAGEGEDWSTEGVSVAELLPITVDSVTNHKWQRL